ncbi:MAG: NUDIX domain-containing protein [Gammaproteobacteria bacterium]
MSAPGEPPEIECLESRATYANRWMRVREDRIRRADGSTGLYGVVEKPDFAVIVAVQDGRVAMVEQYRYPVGARFWEFPQGSMEADVDPLALARAELLEETGLHAATVTHAGKLFLAYGFCNQAYNVFFATNLTQGQARLEQEEQGLVSAFMTVEEVERRILDASIQDATTVAAFGLLRLKKLI